MNVVGKAVWWAHWAAILAVPIWWAVGSTLTGGGWFTLLAVLLAGLAFPLLLLGPIIGVAARRYRLPRRMPGLYSVLTLFQWAFGAFWPLTLQTEDDQSSGASVLGSWGAPEAVAGALDAVSILGFFGTLIAAAIVLIVGLVRRAPVAEPLPARPQP